MDRSRLVRKQITDRNGVTSTRWVRPATAGATSPDFPSPSLAPKPAMTKDSAGKIARDLVEAMYMWLEQEQEIDTMMWGDNVRLIQDTQYDEDQYPLLAMYAKVMPSNLNLRHLRTAALALKLRGHGYEEIADHSGPETLTAMSNASAAIVDELSRRLAGETFDLLSEDELQHLVAVIVEAAYEEPGGGERAATLMKERRITDPDQLRELIARSREHADALGSGVL